MNEKEQQILFCEYCAKEISPAKIKERGKASPPRFCGRTCAGLYRAATGGLEASHQASRVAIQAYKQQHGVGPGYQRHRMALKWPDRPDGNSFMSERTKRRKEKQP